MPHNPTLGLGAATWFGLTLVGPLNWLHVHIGKISL